MALPEQMKQSSSELSNLSRIRQGINDLQRAVEESAGTQVVTEAGPVVVPQKQKFPSKVKWAVYLVAVYCLIQILKDMILFIIEIVGGKL